MRVLMIAFHFPPARGSSGVQRTLKFSRHLSQFGWNPVVLTANALAYAHVGDEQLGEVPAEIPVHRALALETTRHLAFRGAYPMVLALPDPWSSWWLGAVPTGLSLIREYRPDVIWSTYPIATAHLIARTLHRMTAIPWVADIRDPMIEDVHPTHPLKRRVFWWLERRIVREASRVVFTTPGTHDLYAKRYPEIPPERWAVIGNGYDEESFQIAERLPRTPPEKVRPITLVHSGVLYPDSRDPRAFFEALGRLRASGEIGPETLRILLRSTGFDSFIQDLIRRHEVDDIVRIAGHVDYHEALHEMMEADGLLLFQARCCNIQIPAKLYEYLRARRPILAVTDPEGDTAGVMRQAGVGTIVRFDNPEEIARGLLEFVQEIRSGSVPLAEEEQITIHSRRARSGAFAKLLTEVVETTDGVS